MKKLIGLVILGFSLSASSFAQDTTKLAHKAQHHKAAKMMYTCTMHPNVKMDKPGKCPECGMEMVKCTKHNMKLEKTMYTCTMHPEVMMDKPGKCPKCGMNLVKKEKKTDMKM